MHSPWLPTVTAHPLLTVSYLHLVIICKYGQTQYSRWRERRLHRFLPVRQRTQKPDAGPEEPIGTEPLLD
jgi:hypothetical protein